MENQYLDTNIDQVTPQYSAYAGFWRRFAAALIDGILMSIVSQILNAFTGANTRMQEVLLEDPTDYSGLMSVAGPTWAMGFVIQLVYFAYFESSERQATFGKQAMGLVVTDMNGNRIDMSKAVVRYLSKVLSGLILLIGYLMQPFTEKKQALHDIIAGTLVFKK